MTKTTVLPTIQVERNSNPALRAIIQYILQSNSLNNEREAYWGCISQAYKNSYMISCEHTDIFDILHDFPLVKMFETGDHIGASDLTDDSYLYALMLSVHRGWMEPSRLVNDVMLEFSDCGCVYPRDGGEGVLGKHENALLMLASIAPDALISEIKKYPILEQERILRICNQESQRTEKHKMFHYDPVPFSQVSESELKAQFLQNADEILEILAVILGWEIGDSYAVDSEFIEILPDLLEKGYISFDSFYSKVLEREGNDDVIFDPTDFFGVLIEMVERRYEESNHRVLESEYLLMRIRLSPSITEDCVMEDSDIWRLIWEKDMEIFQAGIDYFLGKLESLKIPVDLTGKEDKYRYFLDKYGEKYSESQAMNRIQSDFEADNISKQFYEELIGMSV